MRRLPAALALMLALAMSASLLPAAPEKGATPKLTVIYYYLPG